MNKRSVPASELKLGMYVVELDRPWLGTQFAFQGFPLTVPEQIEQLQACCKTVYVDPDRERWMPAARSAAAPFLGTARYTEVRPVDKELPIARGIFSDCEHALEELQKSLVDQVAIRPEALKGAVASMTESIQRNPDAMLLLTRLRGHDSRHVARAMDTSVLMITFGRFPTERLEALGLAGMLLDVGLSKVPAELARHHRALDSGLHDDLKAHVRHSTELIREAAGLPAGVQEIVMLHHERQDGAGYPQGLCGDAISADGAIAAIVDGFCELTSQRPGAADLVSPSNALSRIHKLRGSHYHEALVEQFIQCIGIYPVGSPVELNSGEIGIVVAQNLVRRLQPRVMVMLDAQGALLRVPAILDLVRAPKNAEGEPYRIRRALSKDKLPVNAENLFL
jgi:HD-GYP domain-containing protein (c-di-GMP phosphodiesterase class II)